jgi:pimeloyl-ACP methyl ester carboxylesterase
MRKLFLLALALLPATALASGPEPQPTVILVHGAFADGSSWGKVASRLLAKNVKTIAVQNPLTSLQAGANNVKREISNQDGPVLLVGHSWGGAVITEAGNDPKVAGLVYVAAFAPDSGQSAGDFAAAYPPAPGIQSLKPDSQGFLYLTEEGMAKFFAQDLPKATTRLMAASQGPGFSGLFEDKISHAAWREKKTWYIVAEHDHMIHPDAQAAAAKKMGAKTTHMPTSHVPMLSMPRQVTAVILGALEEL